MSKVKNGDSERIINLFREYSSRLNELIDIYQAARKSTLNWMTKISVLMTLFSVLIYSIVSFFKSERLADFVGENEDFLYLLFPIFVISIIMIYPFSSHSLSINTKDRSSRDIKDEARLIKRQLEHLIRIASQTREHSSNLDTLTLLEIDLKLTEAEDVIKRANRIFGLKKGEEVFPSLN